MTPPKLRVGLLLDGYDVPAWEHMMIGAIMDAGFADVAMVIINNLGRAEPRAFWSRLADNFGNLSSLFVSRFLKLIYEKLIDRVPRLPDALEPANCHAMLKHVFTLRATPDRREDVDYFRSGDLETIRAQNLDVLVRIGFSTLQGDVLHAARFGVWSFHHGRGRVPRRDPPGFWESMENRPLVGPVLQVLKNEDIESGKVLYRSVSGTNPFSLKDSRSNFYWKSLAFMLRALRELHTRGQDAFLKRLEENNRPPAFYSEGLPRYPTNREVALLTGRKVIDKASHLVETGLYFDQWILLFDLRPEFSSSLWKYKKIIPPKDRFWADPHIVFRNGLYYIFIEEYFYSAGKGQIAVITMTQDGSFGEPTVVLQRPYHLSYPFVFEVGDELYMIPETMQNNTIELYRCVRFPDAWELETTLMENVKALDATVTFRQGKWWLFANMVAFPGCSTDDELFLFSSKDLFGGDWQPHPMNPIVSDCTRARPAGKLFTVGHRLYRPSQNCGNSYGYGFNISEVTRLSEWEYTETTVARVEPKWDSMIRGTHTFSRVSDLHVIDALHRRRR